LVFNMDVSEKKKRIVDDVFSVTGAKMEPSDPLVIAALYYSHEIRTAGDEVSTQLWGAAADLLAASKLVSTANAAIMADRAKFLRDVEGHIVACAKTASKAQASSRPLGYVPTWYAVLGAVTSAVLLVAAWTAGIERGTAQANDAEVGRAFSRAVPTMDPKLRTQLLKHLRKNAS
jgi:hypothetical protein